MKKPKNKIKRKRKSSKKRKLKKGRRMAMSMVHTIGGFNQRVERLERITKKILNNLGSVGKWIEESEGRRQKIESTWYRRLWRRITERKD